MIVPLPVAAAFFLNLFSGFGQTYLIAILLPYILADSGVSRTGFGWSYSLATLFAAGLLMRFGAWTDRYPIRNILILCVLGLGLALLGITHVGNLGVLFLSLAGLRFFCQSMLPHLAASLAVKSANTGAQGRSVGVSSLGHPAGQLILPAAFVYLASAYTWKISIGVLAILCIPFLLAFWKHWNTTAKTNARSEVHSKIGWSQWKEAGGIPLLANMVAVPFFGTALLLQMDAIGTHHGWGLDWRVVAMMAFAVANAAGMLLGGLAVDRFGSRRMLKLYLLPLALGFMAAAFQGPVFLGYLLMGTAGLSTGLSFPVKLGVLADHFGKERIGAARGFSGALTILATAVSPPLYASLVDLGVSPSIWLTASGLAIVLLNYLPPRIGMPIPQSPI